jgi:hypothetical protein
LWCKLEKPACSKPGRTVLGRAERACRQCKIDQML